MVQLDQDPASKLSADAAAGDVPRAQCPLSQPAASLLGRLCTHMQQGDYPWVSPPTADGTWKTEKLGSKRRHPLVSIVASHPLVSIVAFHLLSVPLVASHPLSVSIVASHPLSVSIVASHPLSVPIVASQPLSVSIVASHLLCVSIVASHLLSVSIVASPCLSWAVSAWSSPQTELPTVLQTDMVWCRTKSRAHFIW